MRVVRLLHVTGVLIVLAGLAVPVRMLPVSMAQRPSTAEAPSSHTPPGADMHPTTGGGALRRLTGARVTPPPDVLAVLAGERIERSAPALADLDGDGNLEIITAGIDGQVWAVRPNGGLLWSYDVTAVFGPTRIDASPSAGDLDGDGDLEVVVAVGRNPLHDGNGGVVALNHNGGLLWYRTTIDYRGDGDTDGINSTPALGDLDGDSDLEIAVGGFDGGVYVWHHDGTAVDGFPIYLPDAIWSSPALADIDRDFRLEIVIGTDVGNTWPDPCPYPVPPHWHSDHYCGGSLWVFNDDGTIVEGFPVYTWDIIQSSPAIADLDEDGWLDVVVGTGTYYYNYSGTTLGHRVYAWDHQGNPLPGWSGGVFVGDAPNSSPAVADIDGDGHLEVVIGLMYGTGTYPGYLTALNHDGTLLWRVQPRDLFGLPGSIGSPILGDTDHDGQVEVLYMVQWDVQVVRGSNGALEQIYHTDYTVLAPPAVGDVDGDRRIETVVAGGYRTATAVNAAIYVWQHPIVWSATPALPWPVFHEGPTHRGVVPFLYAHPQSRVIFHQTGQPAAPTVRLWVGATTEDVEWTATATRPSALSLTPRTGTYPQDGHIDVAVVDVSSYATGTYSLGQVVLDADFPSIRGCPVAVPIRLVVGDISRAFLPLILRTSR